ncbi:MAG: heme lyase CcmF/NrfE family subunit [bacterium]|nr:heme lyase CcmF/NrfE family subunit [bacterium]
MKDATILLGHYGLFTALATSAWALIASLIGAAGGGRGMQRSAERAIAATCGLVSLATVCLVLGFLRNDFRLDYVYAYSSSSQSLPYKIGALWGGQAGSLLLWVLILTVMALGMVWTNRNKNRGLMPYATAVVALTIAFFLVLLNFIEPPFATSAARPDGVGLNPQLKNFWMMIHPPCLYLGYVGFTIPFAFGIAALITRRTGDVWFRTTRRWTLFSWFFLGTGILLGSYWAYIELGWGGYWAWDPVENASLMPWLTGSAFLHSVMIQEKKGMLKIWNVLLIILTFSLSIFGTFLTRSGIISSVHSFATSNIGPAFGIFLAVVFFGSLFLLILRLNDLRSEAKLESVLSRESTFLFNNMIFVGIAATVLLLTTFPMLSEWFTGRKVTMGPPIFNLVNVPWALVLLLLTGIGPLIAWRKASSANLKRNFVIPGLMGLWVVLFMMLVFDIGAFTAAIRGVGSSLIALDVRGVFDHLKAFYPGLTFGIGAFVVATVVMEFYRGIRVRVRNQQESIPVAFSRMIWRNKRRFGGYTVHVGVVLIFIGIAASSAYQQETVRTLEPGQMLEIDDYFVRYEGYRLEAVDDHFGAVTELAVLDRGSGRLIGQLEAEQRLHPNLMFADLRAGFLMAKQLGADGSERYPQGVAALYRLVEAMEGQVGREVKTPSTEVGILKSWSPLAASRMGEDVYVIPLWVDPNTGRANFRVFINPMVNFIWLGGLVFVIGAHITVLPDSRERRRLEAAMELEERAVA